MRRRLAGKIEVLDHGRSQPGAQTARIDAAAEASIGV
jgi:hypothetical protein